jgi:hypothetical protein
MLRAHHYTTLPDNRATLRTIAGEGDWRRNNKKARQEGGGLVTGLYPVG